MAFIHLARDREKIAKNSAPGNSSYCSKSVNLFCEDQKEPVKIISKVEPRKRFSSVLEQGYRVALRSRRENNISRLQTGRNAVVQQRFHSPLAKERGGTGGRQSEEIWDHNTGKERGTRKASNLNSGDIVYQPQEQQQQKQQLLPPSPGVWYQTSVSSDLVTPNFNMYGPVVPLVPFSYPGWLYFPTAYPLPYSGLANSPIQDSSNRKYKEEEGQSSLLVSRHHQHLMIDSNDLDDLYESLCQAIQAAKGIQLMTKNISRSLISDLSRVQTLKYLSTLPIRKL